MPPAVVRTETSTPAFVASAPSAVVATHTPAYILPTLRRHDSVLAVSWDDGSFFASAPIAVVRAHAATGALQAPRFPPTVFALRIMINSDPALLDARGLTGQDVT